VIRNRPEAMPSVRLDAQAGPSTGAPLCFEIARRVHSCPHVGRLMARRPPSTGRLLGELCEPVGGGEVGLQAVAVDVAWIVDQAPALRALAGAKFAGQQAATEWAAGDDAELYSSHGTDVMFLVARLSPRLRVTLSAGLHGTPIHPIKSEFIRPAAIGQPVSTFYDRTTRKPSARVVHDHALQLRWSFVFAIPNGYW
jgi:hypothetical protein